MAGVAMDADLNNYDVVHVTTAHNKMSDRELLDIYHRAWDLYYSAEHVERIIRRTKAWGYDPRDMMLKLLNFHAAPKLEKVRPLEGGFIRRKYRRDRRPELKRESRFVFYPRYAWQLAKTQLGLVAMYWQHRRILRRALRENGHLRGCRDGAGAGERFRRTGAFQRNARREKGRS